MPHISQNENPLKELFDVLVTVKQINQRDKELSIQEAVSNQQLENAAKQTNANVLNSYSNFLTAIGQHGIVTKLDQEQISEISPVREVLLGKTAKGQEKIEQEKVETGGKLTIAGVEATYKKQLEDIRAKHKQKIADLSAAVKLSVEGVTPAEAARGKEAATEAGSAKSQVRTGGKALTVPGKLWGGYDITTDDIINAYGSEKAGAIMKNLQALNLALESTEDKKTKKAYVDEFLSDYPELKK